MGLEQVEMSGGNDGIAERIDRKYTIAAYSQGSGRRHDERDAVLFLAKDKALPDTLEFYRQKCVQLGADDAQLHGLDLLIERIQRYQAAHRDRVKVADIDPVRESAVLAPNAAQYEHATDTSQH